MWGDTGVGFIGVLGSADEGNGGLFENNAALIPTVWITNNTTSSSAPVFVTTGPAFEGGPFCLIDASANLSCTGTISGESKLFRVDHPLDPANKYLNHASIESSEMMNLYTGNVTTDAQGDATVQLPDWFEAVNGEFRYQLTVIRQFAQAIIAREIQNHEFAIKTSLPQVKVSWQVTGVRQDAWAKAHPLVVEEAKEGKLRGHYIHPELYGAGAEQSIGAASYPDLAERRNRVKEGQARPTIVPTSTPLPLRAIPPTPRQPIPTPVPQR